jgi:hypothetical protein
MYGRQDPEVQRKLAALEGHSASALALLTLWEARLGFRKGDLPLLAGLNGRGRRWDWRGRSRTGRRAVSVCGLQCCGTKGV